MRLFLSSYGLGNEPERLTALLKGGNKAAVISNAGSYKPADTQKERITREMTWLHDAGIDGEELDLREYFGRADKLKEKLKKYDLVWVRGGNTFLLRKAMRASGFDNIIKDMLVEDSIVYGGYSAGSCVLAPSLHGIELIDDPAITLPGHDSATIWEGLGIISYSIAPHYKSDHSETEDVDKAVEYFETHNIPYKPLRDGEVIIIDGAIS
jgi:dipeptidase E